MGLVIVIKVTFLNQLWSKLQLVLWECDLSLDLISFHILGFLDVQDSSFDSKNITQACTIAPRHSSHLLGLYIGRMPFSRLLRKPQKHQGLVGGFSYQASLP